MPTIVIEVMPKAELVDPAGKATAASLARSGYHTFTQVRIGKRFELNVEGKITETTLAEAEQIAKNFLANQVIEDVIAVRVES